MKAITNEFEGLLALGLSAFLFAAVGAISYVVSRHGLALWIQSLPTAGWEMVLLANTVFLFIIGWTDFPETIRRSIHLRRQIQCWTAWQLLLALLVLTALGDIPEFAIFYLGSGALAILLYSGGAAYRVLREHS